MAGASREFTIGLQPSGRLCARAQEGAVRLEQQLTGNVVTVPEPGEIYLEGGGITARERRGTLRMRRGGVRSGFAGWSCCRDGGCGNAGQSGRRHAGGFTDATSAARATAFSRLRTQRPRASFTIRTRKRRTLSTPEPAVASPPAEYNVQAPPLTYSYKVPYPPPDLNAETVLLSREARVETSEVFHGRVGTITNGGTSKADVRRGPPETPSAVVLPAPATKPRGFWAKLKQFFGGGKNNSES